MLREYLTSAQEVLVAKKEIFDVKHQRLLLAQDEYNLLNALAASRTSCEFLAHIFKRKRVGIYLVMCGFQCVRHQPRSVCDTIQKCWRRTSRLPKTAFCSWSGSCFKSHRTFRTHNAEWIRYIRKCSLYWYFPIKFINQLVFLCI